MKKSHAAMLIFFGLCAFVAKAHADYHSDIASFAWLNTPVFETNQTTIVKDLKMDGHVMTVVPRFDSLNQFKMVLRDIFSVKLNHHIEIGLDSFKVRPLEAESFQVLQGEAFLQTSSHSQVETNRGYGFELRIKLP